jgi:hypothetical protein
MDDEQEHERRREALAEARQAVTRVTEQAAAWEREQAELEADPMRWADQVLAADAADEAARARYVRREARDAGLVYRVTENVPAPVPAAEPTPSVDDLNTAADCIAEVGAEIDHERTERERDVAELRREILQLRRDNDCLEARLSVLLSLYKGGDVINMVPLPGRKARA